MDRSVYDRYLQVEERHFWRLAKRELVVNLVRERFGARTDLQILDIGGACSLALRDLQQFGAVECVEPDERTAALAREKLGIPVYAGALPDQLPPLAPANVITMLDVLEHIEDDLGALHVVKTLLAPGGFLILTVPALAWLWSDHDVVLHHKRRYTLAGLTEVVERAGFELLRASYYTSLLLPLVAGQRLLSGLKPKKGPLVYDVKVPAAPINGALGAVMSLERRLLEKTDLPLGSSLFAVARVRA